VIQYPRTNLRSRAKVQEDIRALIHEIRGRSPVGLHLGCGFDRIDGMINCDKYSPVADRAIDATDLSEFGDGSVDLIEHHHMIEHLTIAEAEAAAREWARVLKPGGVIIITCPNLDWVVEKWKAATPEERWASVIHMIYGSQDREGMVHRSGYNEDRMRQLLGASGIDLEFAFTPYPERPTPSLLVIGRKRGAAG
jgi:predicted SAM-dependent methyltransferase